MTINVTRLLVVASVVISVKLNAQTMSLRENNLEKSKNVSLVLTPIGVDVYGQNFNLFAEAQFQYRLKKELGWIRGNYKIAYLDRMEENVYVETIAGTQPLKEVGAEIGYNIIRKEKIKIATPAFYSRRNKIRLPVRFLKTYGLHVGFSQFKTVFASGSTTSYTGNITVAAETKSIETTATPMLNAVILHAGIHKQWLENYVIDYPSSSGANVSTVGKSIKTVYADFFYAPVMQFEDVYKALADNAPNSNPNYSGPLAPFDYNYYAVNLNTGTKKIPVGARIGVDIIELKGFGYRYGFEAGFRPGINRPTENMYFLIKLGFSINGKLK